MKSSKPSTGSKIEPLEANALARKALSKPDPEAHIYGNGFVCDTESRGHLRHHDLNPSDLVLNTPGGIIPLWKRDTILRWRFNPRSFQAFEDPAAAKTIVRSLLGEALLAWGDSAPVRFAERDDAWDFEIVVRSSANCDQTGCVLASAFFPDSGRHKLVIYPTMFEQTRKAQVETLEHEIGHTFGLRHFFANISEQNSPSKIFGTHNAFSIMNYGAKSHLTAADKSDLKQLYKAAWAGTLTHIDGAPIKLVSPFHMLGT